VTEERALDEIKRLLQAHLENPVDYLPSEPAAVGANGSEQPS
jgi:hypothetical protein